VIRKRKTAKAAAPAKATGTPQNRQISGRKDGPVPNCEATQFRPGVSPNPGGRPKWAVFSQLVRDRLADPVLGDPKQRTGAEVLFDMAFEKARGGDLEAMEFLLDRAEGKPVAHTSANLSVTDTRQPEAPLTDEELEARRRQLETVTYGEAAAAEMFAIRQRAKVATPPEFGTETKALRQ
jgi:hypothetical protein